MEKRNEINKKVVQWVLRKVQAEYARDISLVLLYGSYVNGTANSKSDVDCYYIPKSERGYELAVDFMIDGVGYDIFPVSWERLEGIAGLREVLLPLVGDVQILYCGSTGDLERFQAVQKRMRNNLADSGYAREIAAARCKDAGRLCMQLRSKQNASAVRKLAGHVIMTLAGAVALSHHDYYHFGLKKQFEDLKNNFPDIPHTIIEEYQNVVEAVNLNDVKKSAERMFDAVCGYLGITVPALEFPARETPGKTKMDAALLASIYEEISSTFQKIYVSCETGNHILAFLSAVCLQRELDDAQEVGCPAYELLNDFNYQELGKLAETVRNAESGLVRLITDNGGHIRQYDSFEQFEAAKL